MEKYIYLDREKAKEGVSLVYAVADTKKNDYVQYFEGKAVEFIGEDLPHFITYIAESDRVREATEEEKLSREQRQLYQDEVLIGGKIVKYDLATQKVEQNEIVEKTREDLISEGYITLEIEKDEARIQRKREFEALDVLDAKVAVGRDTLTAEEKTEIDTWYAAWKEIPNNYTDIKVSIEESYPERPYKVYYYYKGE